MDNIYCKNIRGVNLLGYEKFQQTYQPKINSFDFDYIHNYILSEYKHIFFKNKIKISESYLLGIASIKIVLYLSNFIFDSLLIKELEEAKIKFIAGEKIKKFDNSEIDSNSQIHSQFNFKINIKNKIKSFIKIKFNNKNLLFNDKFLLKDKKIIFIGKKNSLVSEYYSNKKLKEFLFRNDIFLKNNKKKLTNDLLLNYKKLFNIIRQKFNEIPPSRFDYIFNKVEGNIFDIYQIMITAFEFSKHQKNQILHIHAIGHPINRAIAAGYRLAGKDVVSTVHGNMEFTLRKTIERVNYGEFGISSKIICSSNLEANFAKKIIEDTRHIYFQSDIIICEQKIVKDKIVNKALSLKKNNHKNVMIIGFPHKISFSPGQPDLNWRDRIKFEISLIHKIKSCGYNVTYKCHPDRTLGTVDLMKNIADEVITKKFELCFRNYENIIFTYAATTALGFALSKDIPSILINFSTSDLNKANIKLIESNCSIINLFFDKNGHGSLDKIDFDKLIRETKELSQK